MKGTEATMGTYCSICHELFKPEDFSTFYVIYPWPTEYLAHDDCVEQLVHDNKDNPNFKVLELGHKIWGEYDDGI